MQLHLGTTQIGKNRNINKKKVKSTKVLTKAITKKATDVSIETLKKLEKKYNVAVSGSKTQMAEGLWRVRGEAIDSKDLALIVHLLPKKNKKT